MRAKDSRPCGVSRASRQNPSSPLPRNCRFRAIGASLRRELCKGSAGIMVRPIASLPRPEKSLPKSRIGYGNSLMLSLRQTALARPCSGPRQTRRQACLPRKPLVPSINKSQLTNPLRSSNKSPPVFAKVRKRDATNPADRPAQSGLRRGFALSCSKMHRAGESNSPMASQFPSPRLLP